MGGAASVQGPAGLSAVRIRFESNRPDYTLGGAEDGNLGPARKSGVRAGQLCLSCGEPCLAQRKYCRTCLAKDKQRKDNKSQELIRRGRCPWCGHDICRNAWIAQPGLPSDFNKLRETCLKKWATGIPERLPEGLRKLWIQHHGRENLLKKYGWPGVLDEITEELLFLLTPPTKAAIGRYREKLAKEREHRGPPTILDLVMEFIGSMNPD
jgi:hypothetical protein